MFEENYENRKLKRIERFEQFKQMMMEEVMSHKEEHVKQQADEGESISDDDVSDVISFSREWNKEFVRLNPNPEDNSDFDSDNEINPLDTLTSAGKYVSSKQLQISSDNLMKKKPIQLSIVGRPNVGKSTFINGLLKDNRVIANDLPGTTRDSVTVQWVYGGRRVNLVDTAGIKPGTSVKTVVDKMVNDQVQ